MLSIRQIEGIKEPMIGYTYYDNDDNEDAKSDISDVSTVAFEGNKVRAHLFKVVVGPPFYSLLRFVKTLYYTNIIE